jgi:hypothetical protein
MNVMQQFSSNAAAVIIAVIPIVGIVAGAVVVFFYLFWRHRLKVLQIQHNVTNGGGFDLFAFSLLCGLLLGIVGLTLTVFLAIVAGKTYALLGGIIPLACGVALLIFYCLRRQGVRR